MVTDRIEDVWLDNGVLQARVLTYGASLADLRLSGVSHPLVLGLDRAADYPKAMPYLGAIVGRVANRIAGGSAEIAGRRRTFDRNEHGVQTLHGGSDGSGRRIWQIAEHGRDRIVLTDRLPDGHMGFPGTLDIRVTYKLDGATLEISIEAETDAPTLCNLAPHIYFNLSGSETIDDHRLTVHADRYQPIDDLKIPVGDPADVAGTDFDLRGGAAVPRGIDHNLCPAEERRALTEIARLEAPGVHMTIETTEPGLQVYDGQGVGIEAGFGLEGRGYGARAGVALEPQAWVDAPNRAFRTQVDLAPGEAYRAVSRFVFARPD